LSFFNHLLSVIRTFRGKHILEDILVPFVAVAIAELGDKTQLSILLLSSKTRKHVYLLIGVILAFFIVDGIAILAGSWITSIVPLRIVKIISGILFIVFGVVMLIRQEKDFEQKKIYNNAFISGFILILFAEWGDKTQIASGLFGTKYNAVLVLCGTLIALTVVSIMAVYFGKVIAERIHKKLLTRIAAVLFIVMGIVFFF
jgi:putative Ca2+/H+ antiporter (TMEM165/GDT1 family)